MTASVFQTVNKGINISDHFILGASGDLQFNNTLGLSTDQTGIIDHSGSTLDLTYQGHDKNEKNDQQYS